ncbi:Cytoplasmic dynein 1 heavy chain 1 [Wickerhamomyces ciferrii]|uniref:Dynein heavy chain, cytoplasmic n=1 Tax=Wickerhamomyces ciferrii (strain ATCC 14091 / BCRC 22168 / CBS 111 / JCM 3599 / NBRC 0793 / NRRL Y-1031 F-60-10) TaxID=1206466 RepID=K0KJK6_WICCF|nr:Cytoplasmic dynein 1 heavy chain 1 [Wickerhamomyces ciferrii]CCH41669.1 Cytoplasmic dynein 1 heavy chain 1 [Wickerhamomyces ciferrii]
MNQTEQYTPIEVDLLVNHVFGLAKALQGAKSEHIIYFNNDDSKAVLHEFVSDTLPCSLALLNNGDSWKISRNLSDLDQLSSLIVIIKDIGAIVQEKRLEEQIQVINLPNTKASFDKLRSLVSFGVGPYFDAITAASKSETVFSTKKKISELVLSLKNLDQAIQIPDLSVTLHPVIRNAIANGANLDNYTEHIDNETLNDPSFLNNIQTIVNEWVKTIQDVTKMEKAVLEGSAADEINFWRSMESSLEAIQEQLDSQGVQLSLEVLKYAKRYHATVSFFSDIEIKEATARAADYNKLMKDIPLNELLVAEDLDKVEEALVLILSHLKKIKLTSYPVSRALPFVEAISSDLETKLKPMLSTIMSKDFSEFTNAITKLKSLYDTWERHTKEFTNIARELLRKRGEKFLVVKINSKTTQLKEYTEEIESFRISHNELLRTLQNDIIDETALDFAYDAVKDVDVFSNHQSWKDAKKIYEKRIHDIENDIVDTMRNSLDKARNSNEMFQVFETYRNLVTRQRIRGATQEYQSQLLSIVKDEISQLQDAFTKKADEKYLTKLHDYPSVAFTLLWAKQVENKLAFLTDRLELILGKDWSLFAEGQKIFAEVSALKKKLNTKPIFDNWLSTVSESELKGNVFKLIKEKDIKLQVTFDEGFIQLFKEVRALSWQGFQVPHKVVLSSRHIKKLYPHAVTLAESVEIFPLVLSSIESLQDFKILVWSDKERIYHLLEKCLDISWETLSRAHDLKNIEIETSEHLEEQAVIELEHLIFDLQNKLETLSEYRSRLNQQIELLRTCEYKSSEFAAVISGIQDLVDTITFEGFGNVNDFTKKLNFIIRKTLVDRLLSEDLFKLKLNHDIVIESYVSVSPPLESTKTELFSAFQDKVKAITNQSKITVRDIEGSEIQESLFNLEELTDLYKLSEKFIVDVEEQYKGARAFVDLWSQFEALWSFQSNEIYQNLELDDWFEVLNEVKNSRQTFETNETQKTFGVFIVQYGLAREKVRSSFASWNKVLFQNFATFLMELIKDSHDSIVKAKTYMETKSVNFSSVEETVLIVTKVQEYKTLLTETGELKSKLQLGQSTLFRQRFKFPHDFVYVEQIENDFEALSELVDDLSKAINSQMDVIVKNIQSESQSLENSITQAQSNWDQLRPQLDASDPKSALESLLSFEKRAADLNSRVKLVTQAASLLSIPIKLASNLTITLDEINDIKSVWISIQGLWNNLEELKNQRWNDVKPRQLRKELETLLTSTRSMPVRVRQHKPFQAFLKVISDFSSSQQYIISLKEDHVKERHIKSLFKSLNKSYRSNLTIGDIWDLSLVLNVGLVNSILEQASSEKVLEDTLQSIRDYWDKATFELFDFHGNSLVRNLAPLLDQAFSDSQSLQSMRNSPFYRVFEEDASQWESKLSSLHLLIDLWVELQRQWIDLDGIFDSKSGIRKLLQNEASRFQMVSNEFMNILKKSFKQNLAIEVLTITDIYGIFTRLSESLTRIVKALSEFLEKQRDLFPRFYFIGNEDLLEIIGNMGDFKRISKHLKKMFAGVFDLVINTENSSITHIKSIEGETVELIDPISYEKYNRVDEWLTQLDFEIKHTLSTLLERSISDFKSLSFPDWCAKYPLQVTLLTLQVTWTESVENSLKDGMIEQYAKDLDQLLGDLSHLESDRKFREALIIEVIHQKNVVEELRQLSVKHLNNFAWNCKQRFYYDATLSDKIDRLEIRQASSKFTYGFEYYGIMERLVSTPLMDNCFLAMTSALDQGLGGSPFGPAGTGKTETIKALGQNLGKMVLVFNCDDSFDFQAMGRLLLGICQVGAWGCFDEFNRLDKNILSAVSSQVEQIELALKFKNESVTLLNRATSIKHDTGLFITMNPTYSGRATLPDNLKKLFRSFSMKSPDSVIIGEVLLTSQGFHTARDLSNKVVSFFGKLSEICTRQPHYDFGLRALKSVLANAGKIHLSGKLKHNEDEERLSVMRSLNEMVSPRLLDVDIEKFGETQKEFFGDHNLITDELELVDTAKEHAKQNGLDSRDRWLTKLVQLFKVQENQQGIMIIGKSGGGKTTLWSSLLKTLALLDNKEPLSFIIDPKVLSKHELFGQLDPVTREWNDGLFTSILRKVVENLRGELDRRVWIIFDGDVDPVWVESLNSVLDDNKLLTLPNGERIQIPKNVRFIFEVDNLNHATPATVSRCGMVWLEQTLVSLDVILNHEIWKLSNQPLSGLEDLHSDILLHHQQRYSKIAGPILHSNSLKIAQYSKEQLNHSMEVESSSLTKQMFIFMKVFLRKFFESELFESSSELNDLYIKRSLLLSIIWAYSGSCSVGERSKFSKFLGDIKEFSEIRPGDESFDIFDYDVTVDGEWINVADFVEKTYLGPEAVIDPSTVVQTVDTIRHENVIHSILREKQSLILCGPPGSGKTMTLYAALSRSSDIDVSNLNFSKETTPHVLLKAMEQLCEYHKTVEGLIMRPKVTGKRVVFFCDEINLPRVDDYGTQSVISFIRQLIEKNGFWRASDKQWVSLFNIQFVGACNPPTDAGRLKLSPRALSHFSLIMVDYPGFKSLTQIYETFSNAVLKKVPQLTGFAQDLTFAMLDVYNESVKNFTSDKQLHYIYSPRELTRWIRGIYHAANSLDQFKLEDLVRIWAHEGTRLFSDRLVNETERVFTAALIDSVAFKRFPGINHQEVLQRPLLYSNWLTIDYEPVDKEEISFFIIERLKVFSDEVMDIDFVLYDDAVDHILRIDRVLKQPQGHLILVGPSNTGKSSLTKFVSWINGFKVVQLGVSRNYTLEEFDHVLKDLLKRTGVDGESICFIVDESTILDGAFLERMNSLLANSQIQEIFDADEFNMLLTSCKDRVQSRGLLLDTSDELFQWFTQQVANNLHVVFTINDPTDTSSPQIITSPALFNRCVLNWMGPWSTQTLSQISSTLLLTSPIDKSDYAAPSGPENVGLSVKTYRDAIINSLVNIHLRSTDAGSSGKILSLINNFIRVLRNKDSELQHGQRHLNSGLDKLKETVIKVRFLKEELSKKETQLKDKEKEARTMLNKILEEQNEAERKQEASIDLQAALEEQNVKLTKHRERVMEDLALAEPAVLEAQRGVKNIKKQHLTELRSMSTPPVMVQITLESVCNLLGYHVSSWRDVQSIIRKDDFIYNIVNFDCEAQVSIELRNFMEETYLSREDYNFNSADRASKACGPLLQWVEAQVRYAVVLDQVGPLREDMAILEEESRQNQARLLAIDDMITELQESMEKYKDDYSYLIRDTEKIKTEMTEVQEKVKRSLELVESLSEERSRWASKVKSYTQEYSNITGNSILAAGFLTYLSDKDHSKRAQLLSSWKQVLSRWEIEFDADLSFLNYFSYSSKILEWQNQGLTNDALYFENVTILDHSDKIPLIIDPLGEIVEFLKQHLAPQKLTITSFLDDSFARTLENTMRFGGNILVQDAEYFDPIISRLLNRDFEKVGGRVLVKVGNRDLDLSPNFKIFLHTRDPSVQISSYVRARAMIIDYTLTESSIENQVVNMALSHMRPDVEEQRIELVKLEGEYKIRLADLENELLNSLSESKGNLLDNGDLVETLEKLKLESSEVQKKVLETADVMKKVGEIAESYEPLAKTSSTLFTLLKSFKSIHPFYDFPLTTFITFFKNALSQVGKSIENAAKILTVGLYKEVFSNVSLSLLHSHKVLLSLIIGLLHESENGTYAFFQVVSLLLKAISSKGPNPELVKQALKLLSIEVTNEEIQRLSGLSDASVSSELEKTHNVSLSSYAPLLDGIFSKGSVSKLQHGFESLSEFAFTGTGPYSTKYGLSDIVVKTTSKAIILSSTRGFDASFKVRHLAEDLNKKVTMVAMGSLESNGIAEAELEKCSKSGDWLVLQNVQTSLKWLELLEKRIEGLAHNDGFKLFLTCDVNSDIPTTLLRASEVFIFENPPGLKPIIAENQKLNIGKWESSKPMEKRHIYFLLTWFHAVLQEKGRFIPIGLRKNYDFNDSDFESASFIIDRWFESSCHGRDNIAPESIQWEAIQKLVGEIIYGGKVDEDEDLKILKKLCQHIFTLKSFDHDFNMIENDVTIESGIILSPPEGREVADYSSWISKLPDIQPPSWIGLGENADQIIKSKDLENISQNAVTLIESLGLLKG